MGMAETYPPSEELISYTYEEECYNCTNWERPQCGWGYGNCKHVKGKGMTKKSDCCSEFTERE